jgi:hypothetical protein
MEYKSLAGLIEPYIDGKASEMPDELQHRVSSAFYPFQWDKLAPSGRAILAKQFDSKQDPANEQLAERQFTAAFSESVNNGAAINWHYWVHQLPTLTTAEAARLMCGLDPDLFQSLESCPNENDQTQLCKKAAMIQRLSEREGRACATPGEWLAWASEHRIAVHDGFRLEVESAPAKDTPAPAPMVAASDGAAITNAVDRGWVLKKAALINKLVPQWDTIERDFQDASENGLSKAAKAPGHGNWFETDALNWARQRGKLSEATEQQAQSPATLFGGLTHRIMG